jgi:murein DD-endopeptidase MepM/ murein hydrolase activator NlpD
MSIAKRLWAVIIVLIIALYPYSALADSPNTYIVQTGDTLSGIAVYFGLTIDTLSWANKILDPNYVYVGQRLLIPPGDGIYYTVMPGDTLLSLADKFKGVVVGNDPLVPLQVDTTIFIRGAQIPDFSNIKCDLLWPVTGVVTQYAHYGHTALDIGGDYNTPVTAAASGTVVLTESLPYAYGNRIIILHENGLTTLYHYGILETMYAHLNEIDVTVGQEVNRGDVIGLRGSVGNSTGPHLHFEVMIDGIAIDPMKCLPNLQ